MLFCKFNLPWSESIITNTGRNVHGGEEFSEFYKETFGLQVENLKQKLLKVKVEEISEFTNFLQLDTLSTSKEMYIIPKFYERYSIRFSVFRSTLLSTSIITILDLYLSALELKKKLNLTVGVFDISTDNTIHGNGDRLWILRDSFLNFCIKELLIYNTMFFAKVRKIYFYTST